MDLLFAIGWTWASNRWTIGETNRNSSRIERTHFKSWTKPRRRTNFCWAKPRKGTISGKRANTWRRTKLRTECWSNFFKEIFIQYWKVVKNTQVNKKKKERVKTVQRAKIVNEKSNRLSTMNDDFMFKALRKLNTHNKFLFFIFEGWTRAVCQINWRRKCYTGTNFKSWANSRKRTSRRRRTKLGTECWSNYFKQTLFFNFEEWLKNNLLLCNINNEICA